MKAPKYFVETLQQAINLGLNAFAMQLMAESFADDPDKFNGENVVFLAETHVRHKREVLTIATGAGVTKEEKCVRLIAGAKLARQHQNVRECGSL